MKIAGILAIVIAVLCGGFYWYYQNSQNRIESLTANNASLTIAVDSNEAAIVSLQADYELVQQETERVNQEFADVRRQNSILSRKLNGSDLGYLAANRPERIERLINRGTENAARCFEILSGAVLTQQERNANDATSFNNECPWLWLNSMQP